MTTVVDKPTTTDQPIRSTQPFIHSWSMNRVPVLIGWGKGGYVTSARWQVTLCDPTWHVSYRSIQRGVCELLYAFTLLYHVAGIVEDSELHSDRTLDDDDDDDEADDQEWSVAVTSQRRPSTDHAHSRRQSPPPIVELERRQSAAADHSPDSDLKDDDWTYPDDNSPSNGSPQPVSYTHLTLPTILRV